MPITTYLCKSRNFGFSEAHSAYPVPLLPSGPGGVRGTSLREARSSTIRQSSSSRLLLNLSTHSCPWSSSRRPTSIAFLLPVAAKFVLFFSSDLLLFTAHPSNAPPASRHLPLNYPPLDFLPHRLATAPSRTQVRAPA